MTETQDPASTADAPQTPEASAAHLKACGLPVGSLDLGAAHPHQAVDPTPYALALTRWLSLPAAEQAKQPRPQPPGAESPAAEEKAPEAPPEEPPAPVA